MAQASKKQTDEDDDPLAFLAGATTDQKARGITITPKGKATEPDDELTQLAKSKPVPAPSAKDDDSAIGMVKRGGIGFGKGVMDVADTVASKVIGPASSFVENKLLGTNENQKRLENLDARIKQENADFEKDYGDSGMATAGRIGGNIVASLPAFELAGGGLGIVAARATPVLDAIPGVSNVLNRVRGARNAIEVERLGGAPAGLPNKLINAGARTSELSGGGAVMGGVGNAATSSSNNAPIGDQIEHGMKTGAVLGPLAPAAYKLGEWTAKTGYRMGEPFFEKGREKIANRLIEKFAEGGPLAPPAARNASEIIPGSKPTLATATENPGLATLERGVRDSNPGSVNKFTELDRANADARKTALDARKGDETTLEVLRNEREAAATPKREAAFADTNVKPAEAKPVLNMIERELAGPSGKRDAVVQALNEVKSKIVKPYPIEERAGEAVKAVSDALKTGKMSPQRSADFTEARRLLNSAKRGHTSEEDLIKGLNELAKKQKTVGPIDDAVKIIKRGDTKLESDPEMLYGIRKAIGDGLSKNAKGTPADRSLAAKELKDVQESLDRVMEKAAPGFKDYLKTYAEKSKPIDTQKVIQKMNLTDAQGTVMLGKIDSAIKQIEAQRKLPGARPEKNIDQATMDFLYNLRKDLQREGKLKLGSPKGSPTFQNLATSSAIGDIMPGLSIALGPKHPMIMKLASYLYKGADKDVMERLTNKLLDPRYQQIPSGAPRVTAPGKNRLLNDATVAGATRLLSAPNTP